MDQWLFGPADLRVDTFSREVVVGTQRLTLSRIPFDILVVLLQNRRRVVTTAELVQAVWGRDDAGDAHFARTAIYRLRKELRDGGAPDIIESVRGVGFRVPGEGRAAEAPPETAARIALDGATTAILLISETRRVLWANRAAIELTGYTSDELAALRSTAELTPPDDVASADNGWQEILRGEHHRRHRFQVLRKDGERIVVVGSWKPLIDPNSDTRYSVLELWPLDAIHGSARREAG